MLSQVMGDGSQATGEGGNKFTADLMDQFFKDPNMQQLLYKYLPEPMRNPQTFEWMLSNPEYRKQLEGMMEQQVGAASLSQYQPSGASADVRNSSIMCSDTVMRRN